MILKYKNYTATVSYDSDDELYFGNVNGVSDYIGFHGLTLDEAQKNFESDIDEYENHKNLE